MPASFRVFCVLCTSALLAACHSGDNNDNPSESSQPQRGTLIQSPPPRTASLSAAELAAALGASEETQLLLQITGAPKCRVDVHYIQYNSIGAANEPATASGALMVPAGTDAACTGSRPILLYAHGTSTDKAFNIANVQDQENGEGLLMALVFVSQGYIVVAPNYAGYDTSSLNYHPYLNAEQSANDMIDALAAARSALPTAEAPTTNASDKLFVTGYSQGGHVAMATHRALQNAGTAVTASAPMSGPYALAAFGDAVFYGQVNGSAPIFLTMLATGYQRAYGNIYSQPTDMFEAAYAPGIESLLPSTVSRSELYSQGKLPPDALFDITPPDPAYAPYTPATQPELFAPLFAQGFGTNHLITNSYRLAYLQDAQANPDGAFPTTTTGAPAATPQHPLRQAFKRNDLRGWTPTAPMLLCGGNEDPTVYFMNTQIMQASWANTAAPVTVLDVDSDAASGDPYKNIKDNFEIAKQLVAARAVVQGASDGGTRAVLEAYHSTLVPPFCLAAVKGFFDAR
ncbi:MAG: alpha/beta hydrolase family protein [Povalibacter sp.]